MPDDYRTMRLARHDVLGLVSRFLQRSDTNRSALADILLKPDSGMDVEIAIPDTSAMADALKILQELSALEMEFMSGLEAGFQPLIASLPNLLERQSSIEANDFYFSKDEENHAHGLHEGQYLLVFSDLADPQTAKLLDMLHQDATNFYAASARHGRKTYRLIFVRDDHERMSFYQRLPDTTILEKAAIAVSYEVEIYGKSYRFCLHPSIAPDNAMLRGLGQIMLDAPELFGSSGVNENSDILGAIYPEPQNPAAHMLLYLANVQFFTEARIAELQGFETYQIIALEEGVNPLEELRQLNMTLREDEKEVGYRLSLRTSTYEQRLDQEYAHMTREVRKLTEKMAEMEWLGASRPRLLRFSQAQLKAAIQEIISSYSTQDLEQILHTFYSGEAHDKQGHVHKVQYHYFYIPATLQQTRLDPLLHHDNNPAEPIEFWIDPSWIRYYTEITTCNYLYHADVFYPRQCTVGMPQKSKPT